MPRIKKRGSKQHNTTEMEFRSIAGVVVDRYRQHQKQANVVMLVLAAVIIVWVSFGLTAASNERKAGEMLDSAYLLYRPAGAAAPDYQAALPKFQEIVKLYGRSVSGAAAQFYVANSLAGMGRTEEAIKEYLEFVKRYSARTVLLGLVYQRLGYEYLAMGKQDDAVKYFELSRNTIGAGSSTLELARIFERSGKPEEALKLYKDVAENLPGTSLALEARTKLPAPDLSSPQKPQGQGVK